MMRADSASPAVALIKRELTAQLRSTRLFVGLVFMLLIGAWIVGANWPHDDQIAWAMLSYQSVGNMVSLAFLLLCAIAVIIPGLSATSILGERTEGNWESLTLTLISPLGITLAKLLSIVGLFLMFVIALAPVFSVTFFLIGLDWRQVGAVMLLMICTIVTCAAIGLGCSALFRSMTWTIVASYFIMSMLMGLPILFLVVFAEIGNLGVIEGWLEENWLSFSPIALIIGFSGGGIGFSELGWHLAYQGVYCAIGLRLAWSGIKHPPEPRVERAPIDRAILESDDTTLDEHGIAPIDDGDNPVYIREIRWGGVITRRTMSLIVILSFVVFLMLSAAMAAATDGSREFRDTLIWSLLMHGALLSSILPALIANSFTKESEQRNADMLHMTLLSAKEIVGGKFRAAFKLLISVWLASLCANLVVFTQDGILENRFAYFLFGHIMLIVSAAYVVTLTLRVSMAVRKTSRAVIVGQIASAVGLFGISFGLFIVTIMTDEFGFQDLSEEIGKSVFFLSPAVPFVFFLDDSFRNNGWLFYWSANMAFFITLTYAIYRSSIRYYAKRKMIIR